MAAGRFDSSARVGNFWLLNKPDGFLARLMFNLHAVDIAILFGYLVIVVIVCARVMKRSPNTDELFLAGSALGHRWQGFSRISSLTISFWRNLEAHLNRALLTSMHRSPLEYLRTERLKLS